MLTTVKKTIKTMLLMFNRYAVKSYSQEGEDMVLKRIFENRESGFYVDVGAHHPYRFSNTYLFYSKGWRGLNVDANPRSIELLKKHRKRDINLNYLVSDRSPGFVPFYVFNDSAISTADAGRKDECIAKGYTIAEELKLPASSLKDILDRYLPPKQRIDFMTVDVEGFDFSVLKSNEWNRYRPEYLIIELIGVENMSELRSNPVNRYLEDKGYALFGGTVHSFFYRDKHAAS